MAKLPPPGRDSRGQPYYKDYDGTFISEERYTELKAAEDQAASSTATTSGGLNINGENLSIGGDAAGRDIIKVINQAAPIDPLKEAEAEFHKRFEESERRHKFDERLRIQRQTSPRPVFIGDNFRGIPLSNIDLQNVDASRANFTGCQAPEANFCNANLNRADFSNANLNGANLDHANLVSAKLIDASLRNASLRFAILTCCKINGADLRGADLTGAQLFLSIKDARTKMDKKWLDLWNIWNSDISGNVKQQELAGDFRGIKLQGTSIKSYKLIGCDFTNSDLTSARLTNVCTIPTDLPTIFEAAKLLEVRIEDSNLAGVYLTRANLSHAHLEKVDLRDANLAGAILRQATLSEVDLRGADLALADLKDATITHPDRMDDKWRTIWELVNNRTCKRDFAGQDLAWANLSGADLSRFSFVGANLEGAILENAKLNGTDFTNANLSNAQLGGALLRNAVFKDADLTGCNLREARFFTRRQWEQARFTDLAEPPDPMPD